MEEFEYMNKWQCEKKKKKKNVRIGEYKNQKV